MKDCGSAFPILDAWKESSDLYCRDGGMSLRDWFAGQALVGFLGATHPSLERGRVFEDFAGCCYKIADVMLAERKKNK